MEQEGNSQNLEESTVPEREIEGASLASTEDMTEAEALSADGKPSQQSKKEENNRLTISIAEPAEVRTAEELVPILQKHREWIASVLDPKGRVICGRANLSHADLAGFCLAGVDLRGADLAGADLTKVDFSDALLTGASFRSANLRGANLDRALARRADFEGANLVDVSHSEAEFRGCHFHQTLCLPGFAEALNLRPDEWNAEEKEGDEPANEINQEVLGPPVAEPSQMIGPIPLLAAESAVE